MIETALRIVSAMEMFNSYGLESPRLTCDASFQAFVDCAVWPGR